ncbi:MULTISPECIES: MDR family MFS transporter [Alicyclobacillus]|uniref:MFS transporter n=1 Tax=Alicyclobacillus acidoterrestris (strain ATCC 49025 / DSM 3922 / CIP 106132 / NCIMB 13137 / GD3B) TaxID=1356854 RepID=T0BNQ7_ALIAG|nr:MULTISPECIES: MFS transporter [Alicyclobacillus]EPZ42389.1 hypothetical protein N007_15225 [Alicyclobacillus acidoterrestris ATCC 49025]UNO50515.1 MFS transporter [Alicyclobacillus acidoterrestris]
MNRSSFQLNSRTVVWWMLTATGVTQTTQFMVMPFMALYMSVHTHAAASVIGLAVGSISLTTTLFSFFGGALADRLGRKWVMAVAMLLSALAMVEFANAQAIWAFFVVSVLTGLSRALFVPASQAMLTDFTEPERRAHVFGMSYWMNNIGAAVGPIIGGALAGTAPRLTFYIAAAISLAYLFVIVSVFPESNRKSGGGSIEVKLGTVVDTLRKDKALVVFIVAGILTSVGYSQFDTTLPQVLQSLFGSEAASRQYSYIFAATGLEVVILQFIVTRMSARFGTGKVLLVSQLIYALSFFGIGVSGNFVQFLVWSIILTVGEVLAAPRLAQYISTLADERMRGAYFGANSLTNLGYFLGPFIGGILLRHLGAMSVFFVVGCLALLAGPFYNASHRIYVKREHSNGRKVTIANAGAQKRRDSRM